MVICPGTHRTYVAGARKHYRMFSQTVEYALRAMVFLSGSGSQSSSSEVIAEQTKTPPGYVSKVLRDLVVAGLVVSRRGPSGGFALSRPPSEITILDVVDAVDPIRRITGCPLGNPEHRELCPLHRRLDRAIEEIRESLSSSLLSEIASSPSRAQQCRILSVGQVPRLKPARRAKK